MEKIKNSIKTLLVLFVFVVLIHPAFASPSGTRFNEAIENNEDEKENLENVISKKFEDLEIEFQEKARRLGYREGDMVDMRKDGDGKWTILPPSQEIMTPEKLRSKFLALVSDKIVQKLSDEEVKLNFLLATDLTGHMTVSTKFENLQEEYQNKSQDEGYNTGDTVEIRVDATTFEIRVLPAKRPDKIKGKVLEIIPAKEKGGTFRYHASIPFEGLPADLKERAELAGYRKKDTVHIIIYPGNNKTTEILYLTPFKKLPKDLKKQALALGYGNKETVYLVYSKSSETPRILPPIFKMGISSKFEDLKSESQRIAIRLGYQKGDKVWKTLSEGFNFEIVPAVKAGQGPIYEIKEMWGSIQPPGIILYVKSHFEMLNPVEQAEAINNGYKEGDVVWTQLSVLKKSNKIEKSKKVLPLEKVPESLLKEEKND